MRRLRVATLVAATVTSGLNAGLFAGFAYSVMPGLRRSDDHAFVEVMRNINEVIVNPVFMTSFMGGLGCAAATVVSNRRSGDRAFRAWLLAGFAGYAAMFLITVGFNVPLNDELAAAGSPDGVDVAAVRAAFEDKWVAWNIARAIANVASFASFAWALVLLGRDRQPVVEVVPAPATAAPRLVGSR
ncbi:anthrone oxygenase family protein [Embleya sp. NPDC055664]